MSNQEDNKKKDHIGLNEVNLDWIENADGLVAKKTQNISPEFLDDLKESRIQSTKQREKDFMRVASIPVAVVDKWMSEGFNIYEETGAAIVKRLHDEDLGFFMATEKTIH
jgi:hypothetical protein